jgi:hypothetical protein
MKAVRKILVTLALVFGWGVSARAAVPMLKGPQLAVTAATNATPVVVTTAAHGLAAGDFVLITGAIGNEAINGVRKCSAVAATTCTLQSQNLDGTFSNVAGSSAYVSGAVLTPLGVVATGSSAWYDCSQCMKTAIFVWSPPGAVATVKIEATAQAVADAAAPPAPASLLTTITNPDSGAAGNGYFSPAVNADYLRVTVSAWTSGTIYAILTCERSNGSKVW